MGKDTIRFKKRAIMVGTAIAALGGALYAFYDVSVSASTFTTADWSFLPVLMLVLGGSGNSKGAAIGAVTIMSVQQGITLSQPYLTFMPFSPVYLEYLIFGIVLLAIIAYRPKGLFPEKIGSTQIRQSNSLAKMAGDAEQNSRTQKAAGKLKPGHFGRLLLLGKTRLKSIRDMLMQEQPT